MTNGHYTVGYNDWRVSVSTLPFFVPQYNQPSTLKKIMEKKREIHIDIRRASTLAVKMCKKIVTLPFHLPTQVPKSPHRSQDSESAKILEHFLGG